MAESDILKSINKHRGKHHGNISNGVHRNGGIKRTKREDVQDHHEGNRQPKERKASMKNQIRQTVAGLAFAMMFIFGLASGLEIRADVIKSADASVDDKQYGQVEVKKLAIENEYILEAEGKLLEDKVIGNDLVKSYERLSADIVRQPIFDIRVSDLRVSGVKYIGFKNIVKEIDIVKGIDFLPADYLKA